MGSAGLDGFDPIDSISQLFKADLLTFCIPFLVHF